MKRLLPVLLIVLGLVLAACVDDSYGYKNVGKIVVGPTPCPVAIGARAHVSPAVRRFESRLTDLGYTRYPFTDSHGTSGSYWVYNNAWQFVRTCETGAVDFAVLNDKDPQRRLALMAPHFALMTKALPVKFVQDLKLEAAGYIQEHPGRGVSGPAYSVDRLHDKWNTISATYNRTPAKVKTYRAFFQLEFHQYTCLKEYSYCVYQGFPGLDFDGGDSSSFTFFVIEIVL